MDGLCASRRDLNNLMSATVPISSPATVSYTLSELMVAAAAREIRDGELVFVGMRLPLIAFVVAKKTATKMRRVLSKPWKRWLNKQVPTS